jgi:hypothetical protein
MKVVLLADGPGTRISEETQVKPKPIRNRPQAHHEIYSAYGVSAKRLVSNCPGLEICGVFAIRGSIFSLRDLVLVLLVQARIHRRSLAAG